MVSGYDRPLYLLPFDHRHSFLEGLFHWQEPLNADQRAEVVAAKQVIYEGFRIIAAEVGRLAGILVDEEFGSAILQDATCRGYVTCVSTEKSGQDEFDFEFGERFAEHLEAVNPTFAKVLVRYDPRGDAALNARQTARLARLSSYLQQTRRLFMFELLVPPEPQELAAYAGSQAAYDRELRPALVVEAIKLLQDGGVEPDVWKIEGFERREDYEHTVETARRSGRSTVGCIVLGRGSDEQQVLRWLNAAKDVPGMIGLAVGRTTFWDAIVAWRETRISRSEAATEISTRFREWISVFHT